MKVLLALAIFGAPVAVANPLAKVIDLMDGLTVKINADAAAEAKAYKEFFEWCDDVAKNTQFAIDTAAAEKEKLESKIAKLTSDIAVSTSKIEDLGASIAAATAELKDATGIRAKEASDFAAAEAELVDAVDTLDRAIGIIEREMAKNPAALAQIDTSSMDGLVKALGAVVDAAAFPSSDKQKLMALVQSQSDSDDDDADAGAPDAATYKTHSGGIIDVLTGMKDKADGQLAELRKAEGNAVQNFNMLKQSLEGEVAADTKDFRGEKSDKAAAEQGKATAIGDLDVTSKNLASSNQDLGAATSGCLQGAADHEATVAARKEELKAIATAKKILSDTSSGAVGQTYSFLQIRSSSDLRSIEVVSAVKRLAKQQHSSALSQLASRIKTVFSYGGSSSDVFAKIKGLITDMIAKLEKEAEGDATEKAYCDEETAKTEAKKSELEDDLAGLTAKIDQAAAKSADLKEQVKELQTELAALAKETAEMDSLRIDEHNAYKVAKEDLEVGLGGVQKALEVLRDYYGGAAAFVQDDQTFGSFMQQPKVPEHQKSSGAGGSIIDILEVVESDFSANLAKVESEEDDAVSQYEKSTQAGKITKATKDQDVKYKTQEFKGLDKQITELNGDKSTTLTEHGAVLEYYGKIKDRCVAKPETYEERTKRREAEIAGLKNALQILEEETAFVQRKRHGSFRGSISAE